MATYGEQPHPRVLFQGFEADDAHYQAMSRLVPTARLMPEPGLAALRAAEWDIVVTKAAELRAAPHMHVLALGCTQLGAISIRAVPTISVDYRGTQPSEIMEVPESLPDRLRRLITSELIPYLQGLSARPYLTFRYIAPQMKNNGELGTLPFVLDADKNIIAGAFERYRNRWCWALPYVPEHRELWFAAALEDWHEKTPALVPLKLGWTSRQAWMTQDELAIQADLEALSLERARIAEKLNTRELELRSAKSAACSAADSGLRLLLTAQAEPLVKATIKALEELEFGVEDMDEELPPNSQRIEDLRLSDPDEPNWTNITEVRGYTGGAKVSDLQRIGRFAGLYLRENGAFPTSRWYLVNQFLDADPDTRQPPLLGAEDDVQVFAEDGGLVIDTRDLFQLVRAVEDGRMSRADARRLLRSSTGVFKFDTNQTKELQGDRAPL
jgi:hypothetical protein